MRAEAMKAVETAARGAWAAETAVAVWAAEVRQRVEVRLGIGMDDPRAWEDPEYASALDTYAELGRARERIEWVLVAMKREPETAAKEH